MEKTKHSISLDDVAKFRREHEVIIAVSWGNNHDKKLAASLGGTYRVYDKEKLALKTTIVSLAVDTYNSL